VISYWAKYWEGKSDGDHRFRAEGWFEKCARESLFHITSHSKTVGKQGVLIDVGCGAGELLVYYAPFFEKIYGLDFSSSMLQAAEGRIDRFNISNIELVEADACDLAGITEKVDAIISTGVAQYLTYKQISKHLDECLKILSPEGVICIFWLIDPKTNWLWQEGYFSERRAKFPKFVYRFFRYQLRIYYRKMKRLPDTSYLGYSHRKDRIKAICESKNLEVEFCNTLYYEYRYNALIKRRN
jgi:cyclopropane-fatty-acyl-phospholipid synthase